KKALILGSGGTRRTLYAVLSDSGAREIITVSRSAAAKNGDAPTSAKQFPCVTYEQAKTQHADAEIIVNATPVGMFPAFDDMPVDPDCFPRLCGVVDVIYNPLRTRLIEKARARNIPCANGLFMLAAQAVQASSIMRGVPLDETLCEKVYKEVLAQKQNVVLVGMPTSGKSTVGAILSKLTGKPLSDTDALTEQRLQKSIPEFFAESGEAAFRREESLTVKDVAAKTGCIIATGGGVVLSPENIRLLKKNGKIFFLDRPKELLTAGGGRPLSSNAEALGRMYEKRLPLYLAAADCRIVNDSSPEDAAREILHNL
ncbi:MAG: shikimate kinase, partial [Candidatus Scatosoma sp.]